VIMSRVGRFVEKVLRQRRIRRARIDPGSDAELRTAILLRSARLGAGSVREEFVTSLHQRLGAELAADPAPPVPVTRRRRFVQLTATAAASIGIGAGLDHVLTSAASPAATPPADNQTGGPPLSPDHGAWLAVATSSELREGGVLRFDLGAVSGFLRRTNGQVAAVSGSCTHLGASSTWTQRPGSSTARATARRSRSPAPCCGTGCRSSWGRCRSSRCARPTGRSRFSYRTVPVRNPPPYWWV